MADVPFAWENLARYKAEGRFLDGYPDNQRTFFAPRDHVHELLVALQASGEHEKQILASWANDKFGNSIAIGTSSVHNAISHLKIVIVDGA